MSVKVTDSPTSHALQELHDRHQRLYEEPDIDVKLADIIREFPASKLNEWDILRILRTSQSVFFDTHVEVVSGHHTATYVRFESIARIPQLITVIARDMTDWIVRLHEKRPVVGLVTTDSDARVLAERIAELLFPKIRFRIITTPYNRQTGKIGTQGRSIAWNTVSQAHIRPHIWFEIENNASFFAGGTHDGKMQNFMTPAAFYIVRGKSWKATHPTFIVDGGMQIATSGFHTYNHNLITELRMLF